VIHYHGTPLSPRARLLQLVGCSFCVPYPRPEDIAVCHEIGQSVMLDNGAFSLWRRGAELDWPGYYAWVEPWLDYRTTWAVIPDVIDGDERANDALIAAWPFGDRGAPVWHMHESIDRLLRLCGDWPRVCLGSSGAYATVGDDRWHERMSEAMTALCGSGPAPTWLHMLRGMSLSGSSYPFASVDSTDIARNHAGNNTRMTPAKDVVAMARRWDGKQCSPRWEPQLEQLRLHG
jgi:hypothetical protein